MKVAIIGAHGFVGARLIESFRLGDGPPMVAITGHPSQFALPARFSIDLRVADPLDVESLARSFAGCTAAVHLDPDTGNQRTPAILCRAAAKAGLRRLVYLSSAAVHGYNPPAGTDEKSPLPQLPAPAGHPLLAAAERQFFTLCRQLSLPGYALRPAVLYGPRSPLIAGLAADLLAGRAWLLEEGQGICNGLYVDNLVAAIRLCLKDRNGAGQPYLLGDAEAITWRDLYHTLARELDAPASSIRSVERHTAAPTTSAPPGAQTGEIPEVTSGLAAWQQCHWRLPYGRAATALGYRPPVPFMEAIRRSCAWWRFAHGEFSGAA
jgi:2-alkyl-3-oxoalkanoate reductase